MRFRDVVERLADENSLPIANNKIADLLLEDGNVKKIAFVGVQLNTKILRGKAVQVAVNSNEEEENYLTRPYVLRDFSISLKVYYDVNQDQDYTRLVINKELLHMVDPDIVRSATPAEINSLVSRVRLPPSVMASIVGKSKGSHNNGDTAALIDCYSDVRAVVAMLPKRHRSLILEKHAQSKISEEEIAGLVGVPRKYVPVILSDYWPKIRGIWLSL
jgi:hypothetical protein